MAEPKYGVMGQTNPGAVWTAIYTVPAGVTGTYKLFVCRATASAGTFNVALREDGDARALKHYLAGAEAVAANARTVVGPFQADETDIIDVYGNDTNMVFTLVGIEEPKDK
jgi:hypothetical protein